jgi:DHA3 family macrolide efflux protein-like MFS transporter
MVTNYFQQGPWLLVWLELAGGAGLLLGAIALATWGGFAHVPHTLVVAVVLLIVAMVIVACTPPTWPWSMLAALALIGWAAAWAQGPLLTLVQANVPVSMHGRALAVLSTAMNAAAPFGIALAGVIVDMSSVSLWAALVALCALGVLWWAVRGPIMALRSTPLPQPISTTDLTFDI